MRFLQFAIPEGFAAAAAEAAALIAGGATLLQGLGLWVNEGEVERERVGWLIVGVEEGKKDEVIQQIKEILRKGGERAIFFVEDGKAKLEWLED